MNNKTMRAAVLVKNGDAASAFEIRTLERVTRPAHQLLIRVEAFGLNFADVMARRGLYRDAPPLPAVLGYDFVGEVIEAPASFAHLLNQRVAGMCRFGAYAEFLVCEPYSVLTVPAQFDAAQACALGTQYCTAWHAAMQAANLRTGETVLIHSAAGGVGTALVQLAKWKKCTIVGMTGSAEKLDLLHQAGVHHVIHNPSGGYAETLKKLLGERKIDVSFNAVAGSTFKHDMKLLAPGGRLVLFGAAERAGKRGGTLATLKLLWDMGLMLPIFLMAQSQAVLGVNMLRIADHRPDFIEDALRNIALLLADGTLQPQSGGVFSIDELALAHDNLEFRRTSGKLAVTWQA